MKTRSAVLALLIALASHEARAAHAQNMCATESPDPGTVRWIETMLQPVPRSHIADEHSAKIKIPIAFHNIFAGKKGKITDANIQVLVHNLNVAYQGTPFEFWLYKVDRTNNKSWYNNCLPLTTAGTKIEQKMKQKLASTPQWVLNIYSCKTRITADQVLGYARFPFAYPESSTMHGVVLDPDALPGSGDSNHGVYGLAAVHEVGHYLGLWHTFQNGCGGTGDEVADTPAQLLHPQGTCSPVDTCPQAGSDDFQNFMSYVPFDECWDHFSPLQVERMHTLTHLFRPSLID